MEYLNEYQQLPSFLLDAVDGASLSANVVQRSGCIGDVTAEDCNQDSACTTDCNDSPCYGDTTDPDCTVDAGCNSDVTPCSSDGCSSDCSDTCSDTPKRPPTTSGSITVSSVGATSITVKLAAIALATSYVIAWRPASTTSIAGERTTTSLTVTITGLNPDTEYVINYYGKNSDGTGPYMPSGVHVTTLSERPKYWSWTNGLVVSKPAVGALSSGDDIPSYLSASGWTLFVQNIKDVYSYRMGTSYSGTLENGGNGTKKLSAAMVNQAIEAIRTMSSTYLPGQTTSNTTKLSASLLNGLADSLNSIT